MLGVGFLNSPAHADTPSPYRYHGHYESSERGAWFGSFKGVPGVPSTKAGYCTYPSGGEPDAFVSGGRYTRSGSIASNGTSLNTAQLAWALQIYGQSTSDTTAEAVYALVSLNLDGQAVYVSGAVADREAQIIADARKLAGPYSVRLTPASLPAAHPGDSVRETVSVTSASGTPLPSGTVTLGYVNATGPGAVTTASNGAASFTLKVGSSISNYRVTATVTVSTTIDNYKATTQPAQQSQTLAVYAAPTAYSASATGPVAPGIAPGTLEKINAAGAPVAGAVFHVTGPDGFDKTFTTQSTPVSTGPLQIGDTYTFDETKAPPGYYVPVNHTTKVTAQAGNNVIKIADPTIPRPAIATQVNIARTTPGNGRQLNDTVTVSGNDGENGTISATLYGPVSVPNGVTDCAAVTLAQYQAAAKQTFTAAVIGATNNGNGNYVVTGPTVTATGCYGWAETLTLTPSGANATSPPTAPKESTLIAPLHLSLATQANYAQAQVGTVLIDTVSFAGDDGENGTITAKLVQHAPAPDGTCTALSEADWAAGTMVGTYTTPIVGTFGDGLGNGNYTVTGPSVTKAGCYGWFETATLAHATATASSTATAPHESSLITQPTLKTQVSEQQGTPGDTLTDTINVTGVTESPATKPVGTVEAVLAYMPFSSSGQTCASVTEAQWQAYVTAHPASEVFRQVIPLNGNGPVTTKGYPIPAGKIGCYTWIESYQSARIPATTVVTKPGEVTETASIITPTVTTKMSKDATSETNSQVSFTDTAVVTGTHGVPVVIHDVLVGPAAPNAQGTCVGAAFDASKAPAGTFADIPTSADGSYTTNALTVSKTAATQCFVGFESLSIKSANGSNRTVYTGKLGEVTELALAAASHGGGGATVASQGGGSINTGQPGNGSGPDGIEIAAGAGLLALAAAGAGAMAFRRRKAGQV